VDHRVSGLSFEGGGTPVIEFADYVAITESDPTSNYTQPFVWGFTILDEDGTLTGLPGRSVVSNHPMMHLTDTAGATPDVQLDAQGTAWASPFRWAHLQVRHYVGIGEVDPAPPVSWTRRQYGVWPPASFDRESAIGAPQIPVIVQPAGGTGADCIYDLRITNPAGITLHRVDITIDDFYVGDRARLVIKHQNLPTWNPTLYVTDDLSNQVPVPPNTPGQTTYRRIVGAHDVIELSMIKPSNSLRMHRVMLLW
jgi:hypothetical protein